MLCSSARKGCRRRPHFQGVDRPLGEFQGSPEDGVAIFATKAIWSPRPIEAKDRRPVKIGARAVDVRAPGIWVPVFVTGSGFMVERPGQPFRQD